MPIAHADERLPRQPLRLWPGVVIVMLQWLGRFGVPIVMPGALQISVVTGLAGGLAVVLWWVFLSRARWSDRLGAVVAMIVGLVATSRFVDVSLATGAQRMLFPILAVPVLSLAFVAWAVASRRLPDGPRRAAMVVTILLACGVWTLVRTGGFTASFQNDLMWRWAKTPEERLVAQSADEPAPPSAPATTPATAEAPEEKLVSRSGDKPPLRPLAGAETEADWPGFRGTDRNDVIHGVRINADWTASPPVELWRRLIGPGWSSFAVHGDLLYTQEQRGDDEIVSCYKVTTGQPVWKHRDTARFWEANAGPGPRGTPTLSHGRVYTFGGTGILNALDANNGAVVWSRNAASDAHAKLPDWGFSSSPLVVGDLVIVAASGALIAYDRDTGEPRWSRPAGGEGYSSPQLLTLGGAEQIVQLSGDGAVGVAPADGALLWEHAWPGFPIVQPAQTADGDVLISVSSGSGTRRIVVTHGADGWTAKERWTSNGLKPYFNDFVVHHGHAFGFDGSILACIDLEDGKRTWKGGRYGNGQLVLLPDQDLLLVLSEEGELALVGATSDQFTELARFPALEGKTWNHPVLVGDVLLVRNGQEMAAFRLSRARP